MWSSEYRDLTHNTENTHMLKHIGAYSKYLGHVMNTMIIQWNGIQVNTTPWFTIVKQCSIQGNSQYQVH